MTIVGSVRGRRSMKSMPSTSRRKCGCGCRARATHLGLGDGVALTHGCELSVRRWIRDGARASRAAHNTSPQQPSK